MRPPRFKSVKRCWPTYVDYFGVDFSFLRYNDHKIRASRLVAEWPVGPTYPTRTRSAWCTSPTPIPSSRCAEHGEGIRCVPSGTSHRRLPAPIEEGRAHRRHIDGARPAGVRRRHDRCARFRQVRRPGVATRRTQRAQGDRIAVRPGAGAGAAPKNSCATLPNTTTSPACTIAARCWHTSTRDSPLASRGRYRRCSSTSTG